MDPTTGLLSQAIQNLLITSNNLANLTGLPPEAQGVEATAVALLKDEVKDIKSTQSAIGQFVNASQPSIQQAQTDLDNHTNIDQVAAIIVQANQSATALKQNIGNLSEGIHGTRKKIADLFGNLTPIKSELEYKKISLSAELQTAGQEAEATRSKLEDLDFLSILGESVREATATLLGVQEEKVEALEYQVISLRTQITSLDMLMQAIDLMGKDFMDAVNKISNLANAVTYLSGDTSSIMKNLQEVGGDQEMAKIYILTTLHQLQTLKNYAS